MKSITCWSLSPALSRSRTARRMSCATSALESSTSWFWQTTQRSARPISRARASSAGSFSISEGSTASAGVTSASISTTVVLSVAKDLMAIPSARRQPSRHERNEVLRCAQDDRKSRPAPQQRQDRAQVPLGDRPAEVQADDALGVDQVGLRHARQAPVEGDLAVLVEAQLCERIAQARQPGMRRLGL